MKDRQRIKHSLIDKTARFYAEYSIGCNLRIDRGFNSTVNIRFGDYIHISPYVVIVGGDKASFVAEGFNNIMTGAKIICASDRFDGSGLTGSLIPDDLKGEVKNETVVMEMFSNIGTGAIVLPGARLRRGVLLTAGSLLIGDTEEWGVYKGNPAVMVKKIDGSKIIENAKKLGYGL